MTTFRAKRGDADEPITVILRDKVGPINLTGCTVHLNLRSASGAVYTITATPHASQSMHTGEVTAVLTAARLSVTQNYNAEWEVICGSRTVTVPNKGYDLLIIEEDLN